MSASRIVPSLDELEDGHWGLGFGLELPTVEQFAFERGEEALAHGVVAGPCREAVADRPHAGPDVRLFAPEPESHRCVLRSLIRVMDDIDGATLSDGHVHSIDGPAQRTSCAFMELPMDPPTIRREKASIAARSALRRGTRTRPRSAGR